MDTIILVAVGLFALWLLVLGILLLLPPRRRARKDKRTHPDEGV